MKVTFTKELYCENDHDLDKDQNAALNILKKELKALIPQELAITLMEMM